MFKTIFKKTQLCDFISLDACTLVLKYLYNTWQLNFWYFIAYFHDTFNFFNKTKISIQFLYSVARIVCNIY